MKPDASRARGAALAAACVALWLAGCASPPSGTGSYVALLRDPQGNVGKVVVKGSKGEQVLSQPQQAARLDGATPSYEVTGRQIAEDFGRALAVRPALPETFLLYFERGGTELTAESKALLPKIIERAKGRTAVDVSVIGHSDTQGAAQANEQLALRRAQAIADQLKGIGMNGMTLAVESHGERNLLVSTPDETPEPKNRRVEIVLR